MTVIRKSIIFVGVLIICTNFCFGQGKTVERPKFPPVFQVEVQGIFKDVKEELDGTLFYDSVNNIGALRFTYQGDTTQSIYRFDDNEFLYISGTQCTVSEISVDSPGAFFPFYVDRSGNKTLAKPEEVFYFTNSTLDREEESFFPSYVYKAELNFPPFDNSNCEVTHVFTKPEVKMPDCNSNICKPTLVAISITCMNNDGKVEIDQTYNLFRFKPYIVDANVFLPPSGVFCPTSHKTEFPGLPSYFSFSYDLIDEQEETGGNPGVFAVHKKVWYDFKMNIIRMDEFEDDGSLIASRVFDIYGGVAYTSISSLSTCEMGPITSQDVALDEMTRLPKVFFRGEKALNESVYVGTRHIHALDYEVWSLMSIDKETSQRIVQDFYFTKNIPKTGVSLVLRLSHVEIYTYQRNEDTSKFEMSVFTYLSINNFMDRLRWEAFDVSPCFTSDQKKKFRLKVDGPPTVKDSKTYLEVLKRLYIHLIEATNISVIRLSELSCVFDGVKIVEFTGWILEKSNKTGSETGKKAPDMNTAYRIIVELAKSGKLSLKLNKDGQEVEYKITAIIEEDEKPTIPNVFQVEVQGIFRDQNSEIEGSLFYDKVNNRAAVSFTLQGETTRKIYRLDDNEVLEITGTECTVSKIDDNPVNSFFSFTVDKNGKKMLAEPEKVFFFTNSTLDKGQIFVFPAYIYKGKIDIPQYRVTNCDILHIFTRPEEKMANCEDDSCQPTIVTISVKCKKEGSEIDHTYNFFRFRSSIEDTNVFLPPSGVFCKAQSKKQFPGMPAYFSFSYDLIDEQEGTGDNPGVFAVHKKVWYDSKLDIIRVDEYDDDGILIASRIFDFYGGVEYTSIASLSTCEMGPINSKSISKTDMTRLPKVFFDGKDAVREAAVYVGTRKIHALDYEVWSLFSEDTLNGANVVQDFYFTKNADTPTGSGKLKISHSEIYKYQKNVKTDKYELVLFTYLSINSFIAKLRWEAFDISPCFTGEQKKGFRLKVEGPPTVKDSRIYQDVLNRLYLNLIIATNVSVIRLSEVACVYDGVKIVEFTGWILDKPKVSDSNTENVEPDMNTAYKIIEDAAKAGKLSLKIKKDGQDVVYKITAIENIEHPDTIAKNRFSGATLAGTALGLFVVGLIIGVAGYYVFIRKRQPQIDYTMHLSSMKG